MIDKCKKPPFPAMSGHFAYTLDDLKGNYLELKTIKIEEPKGTLSTELFNELIKSDANVIKHKNIIYKLTEVKDNIRTYIGTIVNPETNIVEEKGILLNTDSHGYNTVPLLNRVEIEIDDKIKNEVDKHIDKLINSVKFVDSKNELDALLEYSNNTLYIVRESHELYIYSNDRLEKLAGLSLKVVSTLPEAGEENIIYILSNDTNSWAQYIWANNSWKLIGTEISGDYYTKAEVDRKIETETSRIASTSKAGAIKSATNSFSNEDKKAYIMVETDGVAYVDVNTLIPNGDKVIESLGETEMAINGGNANSFH